MEQFQKLLDELARITGLDAIPLEEDGGCAIKLDSIVLNMQYMEETEQCYFICRLFPIPANETDKAALFESLLCANCFYRETQGGIIGIDKDMNIVTYATKFSIDNLTGTGFADFVEAFVNAAEDLIEKFSAAAPEKQPEITPEDYNNYLRV